MPKFQTSTFLDELIKRQYYDNTYLPKKVVNNRLSVAHNLYNKNFLAHYGCVNAIEFLNGGQLLASGGDDRRVLLWNIQETLQGIGRPRAMRSQHVSNIFCLGYDSKNTRLFSAGNDDQVIVHDIQTGDPVDVFLYEQPVYGLSVDPCNDCVFATACDDGRVLICDIRDSSNSEPFLLARCFVPFNSVMYNPVEPRLLATANGKGACLWDVRSPHQPLLRYGSSDVPQSCMSVRWNSSGTQLLALRRRLPPILYGVDSAAHIAQFDHPGYFNSCTMKSCCFAGFNDEYVLSGSDDFNLYMWKVPPKDTVGAWVSSAHVVLPGHRSIVNQVRFNADNCLIASSGVEKLIKVWSPFPLPSSTDGGLNNGLGSDKKRKVYSHEEYISLVMRSGQIITHDYSHESTIEDTRMMAFFDSLVQREIEGWSSDETPSHQSSPVAYSNHEQSESSSSSDSEENEENDNGHNSINGVSNSVETPNEEGGIRRLKKRHSNLIVKLIAKKRGQLMRLAKEIGKNGSTTVSSNESPNTSRSSGGKSLEVSRPNTGHTSAIRKKFVLATTSRNYELNNIGSDSSSSANGSQSNSCSNSSSSSSSISSNSSSSSISSSNSSDNENHSQTLAKVDAVINISELRTQILELRKRQRCGINDYSISSDEDNADDISTRNSTDIKTRPCHEVSSRVKRRRITNITDSSSSNRIKKSQTENHKNSDLNTTSSSTTPESHAIREAETQDSGVVLSDCASFSNSSNVKKDNSKYSHRNYRKSLLDSDSD